MGLAASRLHLCLGMIQDGAEHPSGLLIFRCLLAEFIGTFVLTFVDAGSAVTAALSQGMIGEAGRAIAPGLCVMAMIFAIGSVSGAHINPAVTLAFTLRRVFPWKRVIPYWIFQVAGACFAAWVLRTLFGTVGNLGATLPHQPVSSSFIFEIILSFFLCLTILATASHSKIRGPQAAFPVGATIAFCALVGKPVSGASMNPARSLGPALLAGKLEHAWIYLAGPVLGACLATGVTWLLQGRHKHKEKEMAQGEQNEEAA